MNGSNVIIEAKNSSLGHVRSGIPQGSVLGPLILLVFVNDVLDGMNVAAGVYPNDCILYAEVRNKTIKLSLTTVYERWKDGV